MTVREWIIAMGLAVDQDPELLEWSFQTFRAEGESEGAFPVVRVEADDGGQTAPDLDLPGCYIGLEYLGLDTDDEDGMDRAQLVFLLTTQVRQSGSLDLSATVRTSGGRNADRGLSLPLGRLQQEDLQLQAVAAMWRAAGQADVSVRGSVLFSGADGYYGGEATVVVAPVNIEL